MAARVEAQSGPVPCLATVLVGEDPGSQIYVRHKHIDCRKVGFNSVQIELPADVGQDELLGRVQELSNDPKVHGFLVPKGINDGMSFFRHALDRKVIVVPGEFFDVNPGKRRVGRPSLFRNHLRFSFGPTAESLSGALMRLGAMVEDARAGRLA